jgi:hypothetical protein
VRIYWYIITSNDVTWFKHILFLQPLFDDSWKVKSMLCLIFFDLFVLFMSMHFKPQNHDIILKRIHHHLSSASTIRYRRAEVLAKVLLSIDILTLQWNSFGFMKILENCSNIFILCDLYKTIQMVFDLLSIIVCFQISIYKLNRWRFRLNVSHALSTVHRSFW